jgi:hypothetical protein
MKNLLRSAVRALALLVTGVIAAYALTIPPTFGPRYYPSQQTYYERHIFTVSATSVQADNGPACVFAAGTCSVKVGALPYNAFILRGNWFQVAVCNAATTCTMSLGTATAGAQLVSAQDIKTAATGAPALTIVTAGQGAQATGNGIATTGADGGFDLWLTVTFTGAAPTTGTIVFDIEFLGPNDGGCLPASNAPGFTAPAC